MTEIKADVRDYTLPFVTAMKARNISAAKIALFLRHLRDLPPSSLCLPCPYCFARGAEGSLVPAAENRYGLESMRCLECDGEIVLRLASIPLLPKKNSAKTPDNWSLF